MYANYLIFFCVITLLHLLNAFVYFGLGMLNDANATVKSCCNDHAYVDMEEGSVTYGEVTGCTLTKDKNGVDCEFGLDPLCAVIECKCAVEINENNEIVVSIQKRRRAVHRVYGVYGKHCRF